MENNGANAEAVWRGRVAVTAPSSQKLRDGVGELTFLSDISHSTHTARPPIGHDSRYRQSQIKASGLIYAA